MTARIGFSYYGEDENNDGVYGFPHQQLPTYMYTKYRNNSVPHFPFYSKI